jgi:sec-independent protein translocase protein TatB
MFGIGFWELVIIVLVILLVLGPDKLGPIARAVGRAMGEMRKGVDEFKDTFGVDKHVRDIEALKNEFVEAVEASDSEAADSTEAEEVEVVKTRPPDRRKPAVEPSENDDDYPEVSQEPEDD